MTESFADALTLLVNHPETMLARYIDTNGVAVDPTTECTADFQSLHMDPGCISMNGSRKCPGDIVESGSFMLTGVVEHFELSHGTRTFPDGTVEEGFFFDGNPLTPNPNLYEGTRTYADGTTEAVTKGKLVRHDEEEDAGEEDAGGHIDMQQESLTDILTLLVNDPIALLRRYIDPDGVLGALATSCEVDVQSLELTDGLFIKGRRTCPGGIIEEGEFSLTAWTRAFHLHYGKRTFLDGTIEQGIFESQGYGEFALFDADAEGYQSPQ